MTDFASNNLRWKAYSQKGRLIQSQCELRLRLGYCIFETVDKGGQGLLKTRALEWRVLWYHWMYTKKLSFTQMLVWSHRFTDTNITHRSFSHSVQHKRKLSVNLEITFQWSINSFFPPLFTDSFNYDTLFLQKALNDSITTLKSKCNWSWMIKARVEGRK